MNRVQVFCGLLCATLIFSVGCSGFHQDPLADREDHFGNPSPKPAPSEPSKPLPSDAVRILAPNFVSLEEGRREEISIRGRALLEGYVVTMTIDNLQDFPGATYNPSTETLSWEPPRGWVDTHASGGVFAELPLTVYAQAEKAGQPVLVTSRQILIRVSRQFKSPEILRFDTSSTFIREGEYVSWFRVDVRDPDAEFSNIASWPRLVLDPMSSGIKNLSGFVKSSSIQRLGGNDFRFNFIIDLRDAELTRSVDRFGFVVTAFSRYGKASSEREYTVDVFNRYSDPVSTWTESVEFKVGQSQTFNFVILDPKQEGVLTFERASDLPVGAQLSCRPGSSNRGLLNCALTFTPASDQVGDRSIDISVLVASPDSRDNFRRSHQLKGRFTVVAGGN